ncbi:uncharacterized protein LOC143036922 isoform X2 [Oratosquilla oratoria]|uniref:uncharacterized protein LOC143036922 isoform X2 n=1 Tax=Oratosquilla oratoria TaxID=337810 RepID=UPI003F76D333
MLHRRSAMTRLNLQLPPLCLESALPSLQCMSWPWVPSSVAVRIILPVLPTSSLLLPLSGPLTLCLWVQQHLSGNGYVVEAAETPNEALLQNSCQHF